MSDALRLLVDEHQQVQELFQAIGETAEPERRRALADQIVARLEQHTEVEEKVFYPAVAKRVAGGEGFATVSREEHAKAAEQMKKLAKLPPEDPWFSPALGELHRLVKVHVADEEQQLFPRVRAVFDEAELAALGEKMAKRRRPVAAG